MTREEIWRENGQAYGYPKCCIDSFVERCASILDHKTGTLDENQLKVVRFSNGFIPCAACAKRVIEGMPLADLIKDRDTSIPCFPTA